MLLVFFIKHRIYYFIYIIYVNIFPQIVNVCEMLEKRSKIKIGDQIEFSKLPDLQETLLVDVLDLYREDKFETLFRKLIDNEDEIKRKTASMYQYYSPEEEQQYGVLGIKISLIK